MSQVCSEWKNERDLWHASQIGFLCKRRREFLYWGHTKYCIFLCFLNAALLRHAFNQTAQLNSGAGVVITYSMGPSHRLHWLKISHSFAHLTFATILHLAPFHRVRNQGLAGFKTKLNNKYFFLIVLQAGVTKIKVAANSAKSHSWEVVG